MEEEGDEPKDRDPATGADQAAVAVTEAGQSDPQKEKAQPLREKVFWPLEFADPPEPLAGIILSNFLFNVLTLTFYRFWARTRVRQYLWRNMSVQGEPLEYTGKGLDLFLGFLFIAVAIFLPLIVVSVLVALLGGEGAAVGIQGLLYVLFYLLIGIGIFRARRYRLSRTVWRGVRAHQTGSARDYGLRFLGFGILRVVTLGWFAPAANARLWAYRYRNTWFGDVRFGGHP